MLKLSFRTQILAGFIVSLILVIGVFYFSYTSINSLQKNERAIEHTESVIKAANDVQGLLLNSETGQQGYIATSKSIFLEPYAKSLSRVSGALIVLKALTKGNPAQKLNVDSLSAFANLKSEELRYVIEISRTRGFDTARQVLGTVPGKHDMDRVRFYVSRIVDEENSVLAIRKTSADNAAWATINGIVVGGIIVIYVVFFLAFYIRRAFGKLQKSEENLTLANMTLARTNDELLAKTGLLQRSENELKAQQKELEASNAELEEKANLLSEKNRALEDARKSIALKVTELELANKYKSEFLANMSHELRTPLNSVLVLAEVLRDNKPGNLTSDQVKYASVIVNAGNDLLTLINDILDLSRIESGRLQIQKESVRLSTVLDNIKMLFDEIAIKKNIKFAVATDKNLPEEVFTDKIRIEQILKNLLGNAFKFTPENGSVTVNAIRGVKEDTVSFQIIDTGIGIPIEKQQIIFEAFQQADGSTSRKYGGTGLGLPISQQLATLIDGELTLASEPGKGSVFTLSIPLKSDQIRAAGQKTEPAAVFETTTSAVNADSQIVTAGSHDPLVIIVEDDKSFANILQDYAGQHGYGSMIINDGTNAVETIAENRPDAVILDIMLPGKDGWQILKELKKTHETADIPVHLMSAGETIVNHNCREGALNFLKKPINAQALDKLFTEMAAQSGVIFKQVLFVGDSKAETNAMPELIKNRGVRIDQACDGKSALRMLLKNKYQCIILDLNLPDIAGLDLLDKIKGDKELKSLPVIINTAADLDKDSLTRLMRYANAMVMESNTLPNAVTDEVNAFLNRINKTTPRQGPVMANVAANTNGKNDISGKRILIADDDERNIFAIATALKDFGVEVETACDGQEAIYKLEEMPGVDMVLMDIMMPKMDGYEATRHIRQQNKWANLPIIALTAKAMPDDRKKCIVAGANDYITKPVDVNWLVSLMQFWMVN